MPYSDTITKYSGLVSIIVTDTETNKQIRKQVVVPYYVGGNRSDDNKIIQKVLKRAITLIPTVNG
jgi:uncharacterized protein YukJ